MYQLIAFRIIQGLGTGGLLSCAMAVLGAIASPRERAKYTGVAAAVTGIATVVGPLAGGFFADRHSLLGITVNWRWAFYLNLPLGVITAIVLMLLLHTPRPRTRPCIDFGGAALVTTGVSALLLITEWGGTKYPWASWQIFALGAAGVVLVAGFLWRQARAAEPILPLRLFRNPVYSVAVPLVFLAGAAMMGLIMYVALYLQFAGGKSATTTGLFLLPMVAGIMLSTSISGQIISGVGRYKIFPILGSVFAAVAAGLLGTLEVHISMWLLGAYLMLFGIGIGVLIQVPVMAIQNSVDMVDMGAATSNATFARMLGQSVGSAVYGAVLTQRLSAQLRSSTGGRIKGDQLNVATLHLLPPSVQRTVIEAFVKAAHTVFFAGAVSLIVAFVLALFLKELPMRESQPPADVEFLSESSDLSR